jgi:hypothetical protein
MRDRRRSLTRFQWQKDPLPQTLKIGRCYGAEVPTIAPPSCSQTLPVVTVGGPVKNPDRFCWTQSAARRVDSSALA